MNPDCFNDVHYGGSEQISVWKYSPPGGANSVIYNTYHQGDSVGMAAAAGVEAVGRCMEESSDSEPEQEPGSPQKLIRKVSTSGQIRSKVAASIK